MLPLGVKGNSSRCTSNALKDSQWDNLVQWDSHRVSPWDNLVPKWYSHVQWASHRASLWVSLALWASLPRVCVPAACPLRACDQVVCLLRVRDLRALLLRAAPETYLETLWATALSEDAAPRVEHSLLDRLGLSGNVSIRKTLLSKISECSQKHKRKKCQG